MKKLLDSEFSASSSGKKKGVKEILNPQHITMDLADALETSFESIAATPRDEKRLWLSQAIRTLKEERRAQHESSIQPEASITPEEDEDIEYSHSYIRDPEPSMRLPTTQYHKNIKFQPYKSTRPDLLTKLERFVQHHLHESPTKDAQKREGAESPELIEVKLKHTSPKSKTKKELGSTAAGKTAMSQSAPANPWKEKTHSGLDNENGEKIKGLGQSASRKQVYAEALQEYINDCTIYKPILQEAKDAYEQYIRELESKIDEFANQSTEVNLKEAQLEKQIEDIRTENQQKLDAVQEQLRAFHQRIQCLEKEKRQLEAEAGKQREYASQIKKELETMRNSCVTLTSSLSRLDEEHRTFQNLEASRLSEINHLRSAEQKLNEEIERLQQVIQNMEQTQANMVNQEVVINLEMTMDTLKAEVKRMEATHRQLLIRYATMKNILDESFKQWQCDFLARGGSTIVCAQPEGNSAFYDERTRQQVNDIVLNAISPSKEASSTKSSTKRKGKSSTSGPSGPQKKDIAQQHPMEKLMFMIEKGANVKIILETLIDHLAIATGGNISGSGGSSGPGGVMMRNGVGGGAMAAYLGNLTAGNGPYLDQYEATSFDMMNNALAPGNTGHRSYTYDNSKGEEIFITNPTEANNPTTNPTGGGIVSFAEEFKSPWHHFEGLGYAEHVPIFLRFHGKIQNLFFSKLEIIRVLNDIWVAKTQYDSYLQQFGSDYEAAVSYAVQYLADNNIATSVLINEDPAANSLGNRSTMNTAASIASGRKTTAAAALASNTGANTPTNGSVSNVTGTVAASSGTAAAGATAATPSAAAVAAGITGSPASRVGSASGTRANTAANVTTRNSLGGAGGAGGGAGGILSVPPLPFYVHLPLHMNMSVFLHHYLQDKYKFPAIAIEMGYNIVDAVKRFAHVSDCRLFAAVLDERLPMDAWDDQRDMLERVRDEVRKEIKMLQSNSSLAIMAATAARNMMHEPTASEANGAKRGSVGGSNTATATAAVNAMTAAALIDAQTKLTADNLIRVLKRCLPNKAEIAFVKLAKALSFDNQTGRYIDPDVVLYDDAQGNRPNFLEQLKLQHVTELMTFHKHVFDAIGNFHDADDKEMTVGKLREALVYADPHKPRAEVNKLLAKACNANVEEALLLEAKRSPLLLEDIKRRLRRCLLVKSPPQAGHKK